MWVYDDRNKALIPDAVKTQVDKLVAAGVVVVEDHALRLTLTVAALAQEARILLLDEPLAHLDPAHQLSIAQLLRSLATEGFGVVLATHDLNWATELANHCLLLQEGSLLLDAPMDQAAQSEQLDQIFETRFSRLRDATGRLRIFPDQPVIFER